MKWSATLNYLWQSRSLRERRIVLIAVFGFVLGGIYLGFVHPALTDLKRFKTNLPTAQDTLLKVKALSEQLSAQPNNGALPLGDNSSKEAIQASLTAVNIQADVSATPPWVITVRRASGEDLLNWLRQHPSDTVELTRQGKTSDAYWQGELTLTP
jgi:type II secretory pathway component PulM